MLTLNLSGQVNKATDKTTWGLPLLLEEEKGGQQLILSTDSSTIRRVNYCSRTRKGAKSPNSHRRLWASMCH